MTIWHTSNKIMLQLTAQTTRTELHTKQHQQNS